VVKVCSPYPRYSFLESPAFQTAYAHGRAGPPAHRRGPVQGSGPVIENLDDRTGPLGLGGTIVCVCVECLIGKQNKPTLFKVTEPSSVPYRTPSACAKRAAYPDPPPVIPVPDTGHARLIIQACLSVVAGAVGNGAAGAKPVTR
jgi:hypothetical protein